MKNIKLIILISSILFITRINAQASHELGIVVGPTLLQTDYFVDIGSVGTGGALVYYFSFQNDKAKRWNDRTNYFNEHFRARLEFSYMKTKLVNKNNINGNSPGALLFRALTGSTKLMNFGGQLEFNLISSDRNKKLEPYFSLGGYLTIHDADLESAFGDIETNPNLLPSSYQGGTRLEKDTARSFAIGGGTRYAINDNLKMVFDFRWQRFLSDDIEGLDPQVSANKFNDYLSFFNAGLIFNLN